MSESMPHDTGPIANPFQPNPDPFPDDQGAAFGCLAIRSVSLTCRRVSSVSSGR